MDYSQLKDATFDFYCGGGVGAVRKLGRGG